MYFPAILAQTAAESPTAEELLASSSPHTPAELWAFVIDIWQQGGYLMIPLAGLAFLIYFEAMAIILRLGRAQLKKFPRERWEPWLDDPSKGVGYVGDVIRFVHFGQKYTPESQLRLEAVKTKLIPDVNARITVLSIMVTIAPLMGLLGTVIGMLETFRGLAANTGQAAEMVAQGIRVALITTQTGLMIAIPGYIFISWVVRNKNRYLSFMAELESAVVKRMHHEKEPEVHRLPPFFVDIS